MVTVTGVSTRHRPTVATVDLEAIRHNVRLLMPPRAEFMAVVKANGYGHGANAEAGAALEAGPTWIGVALVEEGVALRNAGIEAPVLVLTEFPPGSEREALAAKLTPSLYTREGLARLSRSVSGPPLPVHVKIDTGMHRVGIAPAIAAGFVRDAGRSGLRVEGVWTHLAKSEDPQDPFTDHQLALFHRAVAEVRAAGVQPRYLHAANSGGLLAHPGSHHDLVRVGIAMYGLPPGPAVAAGWEALRPALSWGSAVTMVKRVAAGEAISYGQRYRLSRESTIATVPVGYADGYSRLLGDKASVLIRGRRYPLAGNVTMDHIMVDCGDDPVAPGDQVALVGRQGDQEIRADELAGLIGTVHYEILCAVSERVPRVYVGG
jgi:alanine racemase